MIFWDPLVNKVMIHNNTFEYMQLNMPHSVLLHVIFQFYPVSTKNSLAPFLYAYIYSENKIG